MAQTDDWMPLRRELWRNGTALMSAAARGAYMDICLEYWVLGPLPNDDDVLQRLARCSDKEWKQVRASVLMKFKEQDGILYHERLDTERAIAADKYQRRVSAGRAGGIAKAKQSSSNASSNATANDLAPPYTNNQVHSPTEKHHPSDDVATSRKRAREIPPDWVPSLKDRQYAASQGLDPRTITAIGEHFRDDNRAKGRTYKDFAAAWRTWITKHIGWNGTGPWPRHDARKPAGNASGRGSVLAARSEILAQAGVGEGDSRRDRGIRTGEADRSAGAADSEGFAGPIIDADEWRGDSGFTNGAEVFDPSAAGHDGGNHGPAEGLFEEADGVAGGRGAACVENAA